MAFHPDSGRQNRTEGYIDVGFADMVSGAQIKGFWLPGGSTDIVASVSQITAFNSATTDVLDVGTLASENAYKNDGNLASTTPFALAGFPVEIIGGQWVYFQWTGAGAAPTAGKFRCFFSYILTNRATFNHGEDQ